MKLCLKTASQQAGIQKVTVKLQERLPVCLHSPCELVCDFQVFPHGHFYLLKLQIKGIVTIDCQRCLQPFDFPYASEVELAVCLSDSIAERVMPQYECIVATHQEVDLLDIITDELHLSSPSKHENESDCDSNMDRWLGNVV